MEQSADYLLVLLFFSSLQQNYFFSISNILISFFCPGCRLGRLVDHGKKKLPPLPTGYMLILLKCGLYALNLV